MAYQSLQGVGHCRGLVGCRIPTRASPVSGSVPSDPTTLRLLGSEHGGPVAGFVAHQGPQEGVHRGGEAGCIVLIEISFLIGRAPFPDPAAPSVLGIGRVGPVEGGFLGVVFWVASRRRCVCVCGGGYVCVHYLCNCGDLVASLFRRRILMLGTGCLWVWGFVRQIRGLC